jgi:hypothetical protein
MNNGKRVQVFKEGNLKKTAFKDLVVPPDLRYGSCNSSLTIVKI